ncbi:Crooked neck-like protein 1 [Bonamia ostreae]|uniref:Crooked neck-like protein 1 n=1 Tax=Bonamia ostreae TaxID=126728 RepID=A0ABV2AEL0_9EUKA
MEEKLKNIDKSRQIFERWMKWNPPPSAWESYIKLEMRCGGNLKNRTARARKIWTKFCAARPSVDSFLKWAKFESKFGQLEHARAAFASALEMLGEKAFDVHFFSEFAALEARAGETEKARKIYRFALEKLQMSQAAAAELFANFDKFEKQRGSRKDVDDLVFQKRRFEIENKLKERPQDYDAWFDLIKLFESNADSPYSNQSPKNKSHIISEKSPKNKSQKISEQFSDEEEKSREKIKLEAIEIYERAVAAVPPADEKRLWSRYIFVWIRYAIFCELKLNDLERARAVYRKALRVVPHEKFTFAKLWLLAAQFEIRFSRARKSEAVLAGTRKMLGEAIGRCPKLKLFRGYIEIETKLFAIKRCRKLYEAMLRFAPENCEAWHSYAAMESALGEIDRARAIYELGVNQDALDMPERLWAHYVDFEVDLTKNELNNINEKNEISELFERLLKKTKNIKVWLNFAETFRKLGDLAKTRSVFGRADEWFKSEGAVSNIPRAELLRKWLDFERNELGNLQKFGDGMVRADTNKQRERVEELERKQPREVRRRKALIDPARNEAGHEDYVDYIFPDAKDAQTANLKLLSMAHKWKKSKQN